MIRCDNRVIRDDVLLGFRSEHRICSRWRLAHPNIRDSISDSGPHRRELALDDFDSDTRAPNTTKLYEARVHSLQEWSSGHPYDTTTGEPTLREAHSFDSLADCIQCLPRQLHGRLARRRERGSARTTHEEGRP